MVADKTQSLYVKSFFAASIREAIERARQELGPDALLLNSREAPPEARHLGAFEAVFGGLPAGMSPPAPAAESAPAEPDGDLRAQMREIRDLVARLAPLASNGRRGESAIERALIEAGIPPAMAREIDEAARQRAGSRSVVEIARPRSETLLVDTVAELDSRIAVDTELGRVCALVGPPGCGKTTTLVKLAFTEGIGRGRPVRLISADTLRVGAADQLRTYAAILGVPFQAVESTAALAQAIDSAPAQALVLIDTPGYGPALLDALGADLAHFLAGRQDIDTHLVLTATTAPADMENAARLYADFRPGKLLFTKLDEASSYAPLYCEAVRQRKPLSFLATGQSVPEDVEPAGKARITGTLVKKLPESLSAVA
jgi:flagellar biosynthesis protein FlhF